jgi:hypothetical protein
MKLKGLHFVDVAEIQEAKTDELKKVQKEEYSAAFQKLYSCTNCTAAQTVRLHKLYGCTNYGCTKACICANGAYFEF